MKYIINNNFGGFELPAEFCNKYGFYSRIYGNTEAIRTDLFLINYLEEHKKTYKGPLVVVDIPDDATDWELEEYDGLESIIAVVDGKIVHIEAEEDEEEEDERFGAFLFIIQLLIFKPAANLTFSLLDFCTISCYNYLR